MIFLFFRKRVSPSKFAEQLNQSKCQRSVGVLPAQCKRARHWRVLLHQFWENDILPALFLSNTWVHTIFGLWNYEGYFSVFISNLDLHNYLSCFTVSWHFCHWMYDFCPAESRAGPRACQEDSSRLNLCKRWCCKCTLGFIGSMFEQSNIQMSDHEILPHQKTVLTITIILPNKE